MMMMIWALGRVDGKSHFAPITMSASRRITLTFEAQTVHWLGSRSTKHTDCRARQTQTRATDTSLTTPAIVVEPCVCDSQRSHVPVWMPRALSPSRAGSRASRSRPQISSKAHRNGPVGVEGGLWRQEGHSAKRSHDGNVATSDNHHHWVEYFPTH